MMPICNARFIYSTVEGGGTGGGLLPSTSAQQLFTPVQHQQYSLNATVQQQFTQLSTTSFLQQQLHKNGSRQSNNIIFPSTATSHQQFTHLTPESFLQQQLRNNCSVFTPVQHQQYSFYRSSDKKLFTLVNNSKFCSTTSAQQLFTTVQQQRLYFNSNCAATVHSI
jgi:hypothetical protein